jgi:hypothetical protein
VLLNSVRNPEFSVYLNFLMNVSFFEQSPTAEIQFLINLLLYRKKNCARILIDFTPFNKWIPDLMDDQRAIHPTILETQKWIHGTKLH